jgi:tetratricopeptide (TPR) repeat protein
MKKFILLFLLSFQLGSAQSLIDSLKQELATVKTDTGKVKILNELSRCARRQDLKQARIYALGAKEMAVKCGFTQGKLSAQLQEGLVFYFEGNWAEALKIFMETLDEAGKKNYKKLVPLALVNIGIIYEDEQHYGDAISTFNKALKCFIELNDERGVGTAYSNLGSAYYRTANYKKALEYYEKSKTIVEKFDSHKALAGLLNNIAGVYSDMKEYKKSLDYYFRALELKQELKDKNGVALTAGNIGSTYREMHNFAAAVKYDNLAIELCKEVGNNNLLKDAYLDLAQCYEQTNDYKSAYQYHNLYSAVKDSIFNTESAQSIAELETKFNSVEKDKEILEKDLKIKVQESQSKQQQIIMISLVAGLSLALVALFFIFKGYRDKQKANKLIAKQKELVEVKQKEILDSIHYAKRIQTALLPSEKYIERNFTELNKKG